ncbi:MAG: aminotransferase class IV [Bacteroidales bacterium]|nr:aminotransferase class IV [Bacteroidales bacterium]
MSLYIESIKLLDGKLKNLQYHQRRFEKTRRDTMGLKNHPLLENAIRIPDGLEKGFLKCRVVYGKEIERLEFEPYEKRVITSLRLVNSDTISYEYKYADRAALDTLYRLKGPCDDILIVKNGCITDSSFANVALWDGTGWFTPDTPLLPGTMREFLLSDGILKEQRILRGDLAGFKKVRLINAMNDLNDGPDIPMGAVIF